MKVAVMEAKVDVRELLLRAPLFLVPLLVIIVLFLKGFTATAVSFWACITTFIVAFVRRKTRPSPRAFINGLIAGAELGGKVGVICATLGIVVGTLTMTGAAIKLPHAVVALSGGNIIFLLLLTAIVSIILGTGLPSSATYVVVAIAVVPALLKFGVDLLPAHFFAFFMGNFALITPPVAMAAIFGSQLAGGSYLRTAIEASLVGIAGFVLPFMFIFCPAFMYDFSKPLIAATTLIACPMVFLGLQSAIVGYFAKELNVLGRLIPLAASLFLLLHIYTHDLIWFLTGLAVMIVFTLWQIISKRQASKK